MKVISKPDISNWTFKHTCIICDAELEAELSDISYSHYDGDVREPGYETFSAQCAICNACFNIPNNKIPKLAKLAIKNRAGK